MGYSKKVIFHRTRNWRNRRNIIKTKCKATLQQLHGAHPDLNHASPGLFGAAAVGFAISFAIACTGDLHHFTTRAPLK